MNENVRYAVPFTPLEERIAKEAPHLSAALAALRAAMGEADFERYINSLAALRQVDQQLLIITRREMNRSMLISRFLPLIKEAFGVKYIRVVSQ